MQKTFDYYRSTNGRLHATLDQEDNYERYLKRIEQIVSKKPKLDLSTTAYMGFANRSHARAAQHKSQERLSTINSQNQILLDRIIEVKKRRPEMPDAKLLLPMYEKRARQQQWIASENRKIAERVIQQESTIKSRGRENQLGQESPRRLGEKSFYESRVKQRKLPRLLQIRS